MHKANVMSLLGLAQRAGKIVSGQFAVERAVKTGKVRCLIVAADSSAATKKSYQEQAKFYGIQYLEMLSKEQLGVAIGKPPRAVIGVLDENFSQAIVRAINQ